MEREYRPSFEEVRAVLNPWLGATREVWLSDCCRAEMTTRGGDGSMGSSCWAVCRSCGEPCDPVKHVVTPDSEGTNG